MTGKVFNTSSNIYQDQAKILFDYYKSAAETIVAAEMQEEQNMKDLVMQKNQMIDARDKAKKMSTIMFCLLITFPVGIAQLLKSKKYQQEVDALTALLPNATNVTAIYAGTIRSKRSALFMFL